MHRILTAILASAALLACAPSGPEVVHFAPPTRGNAMAELQAKAVAGAASRGWVCWPNADNARNLSRLRGVAISPLGTRTVTFVSLDDALARSSRGEVIAIASCGTLK